MNSWENLQILPMGNVRHFRRIHENDALFLKMCVFCENSVNLCVFCWNCSFFVELSKERFESQDQAVTTNYRTRAQVRIKRSEQTTGLGQKSGSKGPLTFRSFQLPGNLTTGDQVVRITIEHLEKYWGKAHSCVQKHVIFAISKKEGRPLGRCIIYKW